MIAILDYGSGNLRSAQRAFERTGEDVVVTSDASIAREAKGLVVPGVGAFAACMSGLRSVGGDLIVRERIAAGRPVLGICVGMQILFTDGDEHASGAPHQGVGVIDGHVTKIDAPVLPHMGWNTVEVGAGSSLFRGVEGEPFYFVHSYAARNAGLGITSWSTYHQKFLAAVEDGVLSATQFHPEKSGRAGLKLISNWVESL